MSTDDSHDAYDLDVEGGDSPAGGGTPDEPERPKLSGNAPPPPPAVRVGGVSFPDQLTTHFSRIFADDPLEKVLADEERWFKVGTPPVSDEVFKRFLVTRRSALFVGFIALAGSALFHLIGLIINSKFLPGGVIAGMAILLVAVGFMAFVAFKASRDWALWRREKKTLALAVAAFAAAALLSCFISTGRVGPIAYLVAMLPLLIALGPALTRSAIDVKLLFPGSGVGGWMLTIAAPIQSLLTVATLMLFYMVGGGVLTLLALLALLAAPLYTLKVTTELRRPCSADAAADALDTPRLVLLAGYGVAVLFALVLMLSEGGGRGFPTVVGILLSITGLYFMIRVFLLDYTVVILSEARAVADSDALAAAHEEAKAEWEAFDREITRDFERERAIYG